MPKFQDILIDHFNQAYHKLNAEQKKAVDQVEGPVMVIAGPGTGKTQILAARIGKILLETDTLPQNILCLTYTDAGTIAMRKRLVEFIGADAYKVNIYTFHAFCNDVIQDNLSLFEKNSLDPISDLESIELFKELINGFKKDNPLKRYRGDVYYEVNNLKRLFAIMKKEGWVKEFLIQKIDEYLKDLPNKTGFFYPKKYKEFKAGDVKQHKIDEETAKADKLKAAVNEFENYQKLMSDRKRYDFDDMINWVIKMFEENPNVLLNYQEKFLYILVDEYQDTSGTQNKLIKQLISYWDEPNVFVVGDDDQSIFRFQGANVENMLGFAEDFSGNLQKIVLTKNYRSTQPILDISKSLIDKNQERLINKIEGLSKDLVSSNKLINQLTIQPVIQEYASIKEEMAGVTLAVEQLLKENVSPGKIAIIYKENKYGEELARFFRLKNIPVYSKRSINILENVFVKQLIQILRYLDAEHDTPYGGDEILFEILHYNFYKIPPMEIAKITVEANNKKYSGDPSSIRKLLYEKANAPAKNLFDTGLDERLKNISKIFEQLIADVSNVTLQQLFANIMQYAGVIKYILQSEDKIQLLQLASALFDFIKEETSRDPMLTLSKLIATIDMMEKENLPLPIVRVAGNESAVNLLTAHGSKGLEFEYVFLIGSNASNWEKKRKPAEGFKLPDNIFTAPPAADNLEELRRLFYVALTRAEIYLYISYPKFDNAGKEKEASMFIAEIMEKHPIKIEEIKMPQETLTDFELLQFNDLSPEIEHAEEDFIDSILEKFVMNVTALNNYLKCPLQFYYQNLIRIPTGKSEATEFGSAIHFALERLFKKMQDSKTDIFPPKEDMIEDFRWYLRRHRENFTKEAFERRIEQGDGVLINYYDKYVNTWNKVVAIERNIRGVVVNKVPLKGKLDKLEFDGKNINVVDYKSGDIDKAKEKLKGPNDKQPNGGDYWRQAVFYKILIDNYDQKDWKVISTEFDFVEPDSKKEYRKEKIVINPEDIETVKHQIVHSWEKIQNKEFYTGCGKPECHFCNFAKDNNLAIALHEIEEEEV